MFISILFITFCQLPHKADALSLIDQTGRLLKEKITVTPKPQNYICRKERLCGPQASLRFYMAREFQPAWSGNNGPLPRASALSRRLHDAHREGLRPEDYHLATIDSLLAQSETATSIQGKFDPDMLADLDLLLTDAFLLYGSHLLTGRVNPETIQSEWLIRSRDADLAKILQMALDTHFFERIFENLNPKHDDYERLKKALRQYTAMMENGGWPKIPSGPHMELGSKGMRVEKLWVRLSITGDVNLPIEEARQTFNAALDHAVRRFQMRHGLKIDGIVGPLTRKTLNIPIIQRVNQIKTNMERWRWLPLSLGTWYILVNISNFELNVVEADQTVMNMPVIVGRRYRHTPVFTGKMTYLELNPYWHIPWSIARKDILPKVQADPDYLEKQNIKVLSSLDEDAWKIAPDSIDWNRISQKDLSFKFRQEPGPNNALGRIKFMFPNKFSVYLHDTPAKELFNHISRSFSSGCIRVEKPMDLAAYLLKDHSDWGHEEILAAVAEGKTRIIRLSTPIPVHILYWTTWVNADGRIHFREDIYGRDTRLLKALKQRPPEPMAQGE